MRVMPRTHIGDVLPHDDQYHQDNLLTRGQQITEGVDDAEATPLQVGEMSLHNYRACPCVRTQQYGSTGVLAYLCTLCRPRRVRLSEIGIAPPWCVARTHSATLHTPIPAADFDEEAVAFHAKAAQAINEIVYAGADENTAKL